MEQPNENIEQVLSRIAQAADERQRVTMAVIMKHIGRRSFGPLLLLVGLILTSPLSGIPGMAIAMGFFLLLIAGQLLLGLDRFWVPRWLLDRSIERRKLDQALEWLRPPSRFFDRFLRVRLTGLVHRQGIYAIALVSFVIALVLPFLEMIPFSSSGAGFVVAIFGMAIVSQDGLLALLAFALTAVLAWLLFTNLLF